MVGGSGYLLRRYQSFFDEALEIISKAVRETDRQSDRQTERQRKRPRDKEREG
jgi:hypothetical protein